ncbi:MAG: glycoside hydrolase family 15 protein [Bdellovibrionota bacterium]
MKRLVGFTLGVCFSVVTSASAETAFGGPGVPFGWQSAEKQGIGTAYQKPDQSVASKVWFSLARGIVTEVYYPRVDTPQVRDSQFLVTDGKSFLHQEQFDMESLVRRVPGSPAFEVIQKDREGRYQIEKTIWADPDSSTLLQKVRFTANVEGLQLYYLHKPAAANSLFGDNAESEPELLAGEENGVFSAWQVVRASTGWAKKSVGYVGKSDGFTDLRDDFKMSFEFTHAPRGNVALMGQLVLPAKRGSYEFAVSIHFGVKKQDALQTKNVDLAASYEKYQADWKRYLAGLNRLTDAHSPLRRRQLEESSILILKTSEDKTYPGAGVASLSHPWGDTQIENEHVNPYGNSGYHVVWPRDLYHVGNAFLAVGDIQSVLAVLDRMRAAQYTDKDGEWQFGSRTRKKTGSFPQNFWVDGRTHWGGYQADQTAMPVLFAYRLWKRGLIEPHAYWEMVSRALSFLAEMGPWTHRNGGRRTTAFRLTRRALSSRRLWRVRKWLLAWVPMARASGG